MGIISYIMISYLIFAIITQIIIGYACYKAPQIENYPN